MSSAVVKKNFTLEFTNAIKIIRDMPKKRIMPVSSILRLSKDDLVSRGADDSLSNVLTVGTGIFIIHAKRGKTLKESMTFECDHFDTDVLNLSFKVSKESVRKQDLVFVFRHEQGKGKQVKFSNFGTGQGIDKENTWDSADLSINKENLATYRIPGEGEKFAYDLEKNSFVIVNELSKNQFELRPEQLVETDPFRERSISYLVLMLENGKWQDKLYPRSIQIPGYFPLVDAKL